MTGKRVTIHDVAKAAGVSITTVSRYLNQRYDAMSGETKVRIADVIANLHYRPNALAQGLKGNRSKMISVMVVNIGYPYNVSLIRTLTHELDPAGYNLLVCESEGDREREAHLLRSLVAQQIDALVLQTNGDNNALVAEIAAQFPVILVDRHFDIPRVTCVVTDNEPASATLASALYREGYERVLFVTEREDGVSTRQQRLDGYRRACGEYGRNPWIGYVDRGDPATFAALVPEVETAAAGGPVAVYTANGLLMLKLYPALRALSTTQTGRIGLATFDEPDWAPLVFPPLTCVRQPTAEIGAWVGKRLLALLDGRGKLGKPALRTLPSTLIWQKSTSL
ncbi:MAG: LacI family DNA-binding transcriptional regulator [Bacilli bacterium]